MDALPEDAPLSQAFDLSGRVAALTGGASGIGRATAHVLSGAGAAVVIGDIDEAGAEKVAAEIAERGGKAVAMRIDVTSKADVDALVQRAVDEHGRLDIMGNIAGIPSRSMVVDLSEEQLDKIIDINLKGVVWGCQAAMKVMMGQPTGGNIVNISSGIIDAGGAPTFAPYAMTKAAVAILTKTVAREGGPYNIRANAIAPGTILTNFSLPNFTGADGKVDEERFKQWEKMSTGNASIQRLGTASDIAWSILYLVSDAASYVTGHIMRPNGGTAMPW